MTLMVKQQNNQIKNASQLGLILYTVLVLHFLFSRVNKSNFFIYSYLPTYILTFLLNQASSVHPLERVLHQASVVAGTTASPGLGHPHQRMEGRQVTDVLKVITVPRAPQHHCPVP